MTRPLRLRGCLRGLWRSVRRSKHQCGVSGGSSDRIVGRQRRGKDDLAARGTRTGSPGPAVPSACSIAIVGRNGRAKRSSRALAYLPQGADAHWPVSGAQARRSWAVCRTASRFVASHDDLAIITWMAPLRRVDLAGGASTNCPSGERARGCFWREPSRPRRHILLADEPAAHLDPAHQLRLMELLREEARRGTDGRRHHARSGARVPLLRRGRWCSTAAGLAGLGTPACRPFGPYLATVSVSKPWRRRGHSRRAVSYYSLAGDLSVFALRLAQKVRS